MFTLDNPYTNGQQIFSCLHDDQKPTGNRIKNGDLCKEIDTGKKFLFDAENHTWIEWEDSVIAVVG